MRYFSRSYLSSSVVSSSLVWPLILNTFTTGMMDAVSFAEFAIFSSNQTGNVIILLSRAIGVSQRYYPGGQCSGPSLLTVGISLASFLSFAFCLGRMGIFFGHLHRSFLLASTAIQAILLLFAAALIQTQVLPPGKATLPSNAKLDAIPVSLLSASSGLQVAQARCSGVQEVPTAMLTSPLVDFLVHPFLFSPFQASGNDREARSRNIRFFYLISFFVGIAIGATIHRFGGTAVVTYVAFALRSVNLVAFWFLPSDQSAACDSSLGT